MPATAHAHVGMTCLLDLPEKEKTHITLRVEGKVVILQAVGRGNG